MEEFIYYNNLYDCYYKLLTEKQRVYFEEYYFNNLSLSEISENYGVSRNAVYKQIQITIEKLKEYEEKLGLYKKKEYLEKELKNHQDPRIKKIINRLLKLFVVIFIFLFNTNVHAKNTINDINIDVNIQENGDAMVTEKWNVYTDKGTEIYRTYGNLNRYNITNFSVSDDKNNYYETVKNWDVSASFNDKKYKSGTRYEDDQLELCWGISEYGNQKYTLNYNIEKLVKQYVDSQGIYFSFLASNMNPLPENVTIKIHSDYFKFNENNSLANKEGYHGNVIFNNGSIIYEKTEPILPEEYITSIVQIKENVFNPVDSIDEEFNNYININEENASKNKTSTNNVVLNVLSLIICFIISLIIIIPHFLNLIPHKRNNNMKRKGYKLDKQKTYYREIPCNGNLSEIYWIAYNYNLIDDEGCIFGAYLLKWLADKQIFIDKANDGIYDLENKKYTFNFSKISNFDDQQEENLKNIFLGASSRDYILEPFEFKEWCKEHYSQIISWLDDFLYGGQKRLENKGLLKKEEIVTKYNYQKFIKSKIIKTKEIDEIANNLQGLKEFMLDFSNFKDKDMVEVSNWENYLIVAEILGISDKVSKELSKMYPDYEFVEKLNIATVINISTELSKLSYNTAMEMNRSVGGLVSNDNTNTSNSININSGNSGGRSSGGGIR